MKIKINDPFGFQKAINFEKLDGPKTLKKLSSKWVDRYKNMFWNKKSFK